MMYDDEDYFDELMENRYEEDAYIASRGDIDKCMNCGKYKFNDELNKDQVCILPCRNPQEY